MLEAAQYHDNAFVTLTISDDNLTFVNGVSSSSGMPTLVPKDLQDWLKRLRAKIAPFKLRFYGVGEYGDVSQRPHYHVALFGFATCERERTVRNTRTREPDWRRCCSRCRLVGETWGKGHVDLGTVETDSAQYLAGYVTKKMTSAGDTRLHGRHPEFARMSLRPGIGFDAMHDVADVVMKLGLVESQGDVPSALRHGCRLMPLGRYLRRKLRLMTGGDENAPPELLAKVWEEAMLPLLEAAKKDPEAVSLRQQMAKVNAEFDRQLAARQRIYKKREI